MAKSNSIRGLKKQASRLINKNRLIEARNILQPLCKSVPNDLGSWYTLADISYTMNQLGDAEYCCNHILSKSSDHQPASHMLAMIHHRKRSYDTAIRLYETSIKNNYKVTETLYLIGTAYRECGNLVLAQKNYEKVLQAEPDDFKTLNNLSEIYISSGRISDAIQLLEKADEGQPGHEFVINNLGKAYLTLGNADKASSLFRSLLDIPGSGLDKISNYLLTLNYLNDKTPEFIFQAHQQWCEKRLTDNSNKETCTKRRIEANQAVRIGIISADFNDHPVVRFIYSFIKHHDPTRFQLYCYSSTLRIDHVSHDIKKKVFCWRDTQPLNDQQLSDLISSDNIDICMDLAGHTSGNRMPLLASRVSPLQITYIGYPNTSGLETMDYRITDHYADPPGIADALHTEKLLRLEQCFLSYTPDLFDMNIDKTVTKDNDMVRFGSFNNLAKTTPVVIETWCKILSRVENSRLVLKSQTTSDKTVQQYYIDLFSSHGIDSERLEFINCLANKVDHLIYYNNVDIALDTFPYNGTTTTIEALWMGTPVIALCGDSHVSRVGYSILSNIGHTDLIASNIDEYIDLAVALANDTETVSQLHNSLHDSLAGSCILDHISHTQEIEKLLFSAIEQYNNSI